MVCTKLNFVSILGQSERRGHDASIAHEDVETGSFRLELLGCLFDRRQRCQITFDKGQLCFSQFLGLVNNSSSPLPVAPAEVDVLWVVFCESENRFLAQASGSCVLLSASMTSGPEKWKRKTSCDENDFASKVRNVIFRVKVEASHWQLIKAVQTIFQLGGNIGEQPRKLMVMIDGDTTP